MVGSISHGLDVIAIPDTGVAPEDEIVRIRGKLPPLLRSDGPHAAAARLTLVIIVILHFSPSFDYVAGCAENVSAIPRVGRLLSRIAILQHSDRSPSGNEIV